MTFEDNNALREVLGELGAHLKLIGREMQLDVSQRGNTLRLASTVGPVGPAANLLQQLYDLADAGRSLSVGDISAAIRLLRTNPDAHLGTYFSDVLLHGVDSRPIAPRTEGQRAYVETMRHHDVVFGVGPAGTGKTYLAMAMAIAAHRRGDVRRIILTRPAVEAGEKLGFLPGDLNEKVDPYLRPLFDALQDMLPTDRINRMMERRTIEVAPLAFMRGRTLSDAFVILDEAQNTTVEQMRMFLTRLGEGSRMVVNGDDTQIDLPRGKTSGLVHVLQLVEDIEAIGITRLDTLDIVRHPLVGVLVKAYARDDERRRRRAAPIREMSS